MTTENPYASPVAAPEKTEVPKNFRWRILPAALGFIVGGLILCYGSWMLVMGAMALQHEEIPTWEKLLFFAAGTMNSIGGIAWILAGYFCFCRRWAWALGYCAVGGILLLGFIVLVILVSIS